MPPQKLGEGLTGRNLQPEHVRGGQGISWVPSLTAKPGPPRCPGPVDPTQPAPWGPACPLAQALPWIKALPAPLAWTPAPTAAPFPGHCPSLVPHPSHTSGSRGLRFAQSPGHGSLHFRRRACRPLSQSAVGHCISWAGHQDFWGSCCLAGHCVPKPSMWLARRSLRSPSFRWGFVAQELLVRVGIVEGVGQCDGMVTYSSCVHAPDECQEVSLPPWGRGQEGDT